MAQLTGKSTELVFQGIYRLEFFSSMNFFSFIYCLMAT